LPHFVCVCVCVGEIISLPWFSKELKNNSSKNNCLRGVILILLVRESIFVGWGFSVFNSAGAWVQVIFVSHSYQTWFTWLSGNWCLCVWVAWPRDHEVRINYLIKSILNNLPIYYLFLFPIPITIDAKIEKQIQPFLWFGEEGGKKYAMLNGPSLFF